MAVAALAWAIASRHRKQWVLPVEQLTTLIREVRAGVAPSEELTDVQGSLQDVAEEVKSLLRDMRRQKQEIVDLNQEVRQRIANRNNAVERTINALRQQTVRDPLTGLYNQRALDQMLPPLIAQCGEDHKPLAMLMLDLERFEEFKHALGHTAGDELLRTLGQIIHSTIREADAAFRGGADQFVILLPGCDAAMAKNVAERLQSLVQSMSATYRVAARPALSIGISTLNDVAEPTAERMLRRADERLRANKAA
jgi:diguanylate cyclase (GGDEF)-like protein